jgi:phage terminase large subunit
MISESHSKSSVLGSANDADETNFLDINKEEQHDNLNDSRFSSNPDYPGAANVDDPIPEGGYRDCGLTFPDPFFLLCFFDPDINNKIVTLHPWQMEDLKLLGSTKSTAQHPYKYCLIAANGSGKDKYIIAPFSIWFTLTKIRSRTIITTSSGTQLTNQTEPYIKDLAEKVNKFFGQEIFRIRQRFIKCLLTGSEIRMFATDEAGKAEGYHPLDANSEMAIIENEAKSIAEDIDQALRRCSGYNYWLKISSAGEPRGHFYNAATKWPNVRRVTSYECFHISREEIEEDLQLDGKFSAFFRSKHLSLFTSIGGQVIIPLELVNYCLEFPPKFTIKLNPDVDRIGIDLAAGGDENAICITRGNKVRKQYSFREKDTTLAAERIEKILRDENISKNHKFIFADDGGVGKAIIDMLCRKGWNINRIMNQWTASNKKQFGNKGAEHWFRVSRIIEEKIFDLTTLDQKTCEQLYSRSYKQTLTGGRIFLQDKREARAHGFPSPDRADAFILSLTGLTIEDFVNAQQEKNVDKDKRPKTKFNSQDEILKYYEDEITFNTPGVTKSKVRLFNSLQNALNN